MKLADERIAAGLERADPHHALELPAITFSTFIALLSNSSGVASSLMTVMVTRLLAGTLISDGVNTWFLMVRCSLRPRAGRRKAKSGGEGKKCDNDA